VKKNMSLPTRPLSTQLRGQSGQNAASSTNQSPVLVARIAEKKAELENLKQLRDLSAAVATQMEALEQKLATLSDGTEGISPQSHAASGLESLIHAAIATVVGNWHNVLRAINMASGSSSVSALKREKERDVHLTRVLHSEVP
jgi:DASH complex subunit DAD2